MISIHPRTWVCFLTACQIAFLAITSAANATLTANAGTDQTKGKDVAVVLDGTGSSDSGGATLTYYWHQTSGSHVDFVGYDRPKPIIIPPTPAGTYVFTLEVNNGTTTATDTVTVTVQAPTGTTRYVDGLLSGTTSTYSIANRDGSGTDGPGYKTLQAAADVVNPGDTVYIRAGTYTDDFSATPTTISAMHIIRSGTSTNPIRFQNYNGESVVIQGSGSFSDLDQDTDGWADGVAHPGKKEWLVWIEADYIQLVGVKVTNSEFIGVTPYGASYTYLQDVEVSNTWYAGIRPYYPTSKALQGNVFRWVEVHHCRHGYGFYVYLEDATPITWDNNVIVDSLFYGCGHEASGDELKVLPTTTTGGGITSDPQGGGNAAGMSQAEGLYNDDPINNLGHNNYCIRDVAYRNVNGNINFVTNSMVVEDSDVIAAGPANNGTKVRDPVDGSIYRGNFIYYNSSRGVEARSSTTNGQYLNNTSLRNWGNGIWTTTIIGTFKNNLSAFNVGDYSGGASGLADNWSGDTTAPTGHRGNPLLQSDNFGNPQHYAGRIDPYPPGNATNTTSDYPNLFLDMNWPGGSTIAQKVAYVRDEIKAAFTPAADSPVIDAGVLVAGYYCPTADDSGSPPASDDPRRHWFGSAPDIGAFEYNPGNPPPTPTPTATPTPSATPEAPQNLRVLP